MCSNQKMRTCVLHTYICVPTRMRIASGILAKKIRLVISVGDWHCEKNSGEEYKIRKNLALKVNTFIESFRKQKSRSINLQPKVGPILFFRVFPFPLDFKR